MKKTITVYVNYYDREVATEKEFQRMVEQERVHLMNDVHDIFNEWLENRFSHFELWDMCPSRRLGLLDDFNKDCIEQARANIADEWEAEEIEIEI